MSPSSCPAWVPSGRNATARDRKHCRNTSFVASRCEVACGSHPLQNRGHRRCGSPPVDTERANGNGFRYNRLAARLVSHGALHDSGARLLLRRHGPESERAQHAHDELLVRTRRPPRVGRASGTRSRSAAPARSSATSTAPSCGAWTSPATVAAACWSLVFLGMFAAITPALISGAVADRMKFSAWALFVPVWSLLVYCPGGRSGSTAGIGSDGENALTGWLGAGARSTSPAAPSSTSTRASPRWPPCWCWASARDGRRRATRRTRCRWS